MIFGWVLHQQTIWEDLRSRLDTGCCEVHSAALVCGEEALRRRIAGDVRAGIRSPDAADRALQYLPLYAALTDIPLLDTTALSPEETAETILHQEEKECAVWKTAPVSALCP